MPVYLKKRIVKGWKQKENERYGDCLVIKFCDSKTDKVLFEWAPNLHEEEFINDMWKDLKVYDELHKATMEIENKIHLSSTTKGLLKNCENNK